MEHKKWKQPIEGLLIAIIFCLAFLAGRFNSLDQWYLPAGVRAAAFLFFPYRYWPYLLVGDCSAMLLLRVPRIPVDNATWAYSGSLIMPLLSCLAIAGAREKLRSLSEQAKWLPLIAAYLSIWMAGSTIAINNAFRGPPDGITLEFFYVRCVGHFLTIVTLSSLSLLWLGRHERGPQHKFFLRDALLSLSAIALIFCLIVIPQKIGEYLRIGLMVTMLVPIIFMTHQHGRKGAFLGIAATCFAVARTLYYLNTEGAYDKPVFIVEHILVIASFGLPWLGHSISSQHATSRVLSIAEKEARDASRDSFLVSEPMLRDKAIKMEKAYLLSEDARKRSADHLKHIGDYEGALKLNNESVEHSMRFGAYIADIYPLKIEDQGLNAVLNSQEFSDARGGGAHVLPLLGSNPTHLSLQLQLVAYRCASRSIDTLSELQPRAYVIKTRIRKTKRIRGIIMIVTARDPTRMQSTPESTKASAELSARVKAHGGIVKRRHAHRISLWLSESIEPTVANQ